MKNDEPLVLRPTRSFEVTARKRKTSLEGAAEAVADPDAIIVEPGGPTWYFLGETAYLVDPTGSVMTCQWSKRVEGVRTLMPSEIKVSHQVHKLMVSRGLDSDDALDGWEDPESVFAPHHTSGTWRLHGDACWLFSPSGDRVIAVRAPRLGTRDLPGVVEVEDPASGHVFEIDSILDSALRMAAERGLDVEEVLAGLEDADRRSVFGCTLSVLVEDLVVKVDLWGTVISVRHINEGHRDDD